MSAVENNKISGKILLVEDEFNIAKLFMHNLSKAGFNCEHASNGKEGLKLAHEIKPDLIISDIMMPEMDGFEFRRELLKDPELKTIPFVFLTAKGSEEDILKGFDLEIEDYIIKTASPKVVIAKVSAILKSLEKERVKVVDEVQRAADSMVATVVPDVPPKFQGLEINQLYMPYKNVPGGDFIDYFSIDDNNIVVILGDVMGKRWGAWYFAVAYAGYVRSAARFVLESSKEFKPSEILQRINESVYKDERISEVFITLSIIIIDVKNKIAKYSGAGDLPIIHKSSKQAKYIQSTGLLLGFSQSGQYEDHEIKLQTGEEIILITDGITESRNKKGEQYGQERLINFLSSLSSNDNTIDALKKEIMNFTDGELEDDVSIISIKMT
ncbi:MAG: SpoIIE family protein phosphatase [Melioribacter sp.]|uniref:SpoIIE family protein phosphatase n=1 Tax=Rosettibacter primus TaxID=3111523 RepID=UPI00247CE199|nr:SpoIIE family protein phosphatase [Melioribacter sp.]